MADLPSTPWGKAEALLGSGALSSVYLLPAVGGQPRTAVTRRMVRLLFEQILPSMRPAHCVVRDYVMLAVENVGLLWPTLLSFTIAYITCYNSIGDIANYLLLLHSKAECC